MANKRLFLIDGNSFCYRAFYAIKSLSNSKGQPTNAAYGFATMLNKLIDEEKPDMLAIAFDLKGPTFRHRKFEQYKIHRKPMPDDLISQMPIIKNMVAAYGIPMFEMQGYEADDIIATIARRAENERIETYIVTGDKDALQLVDPLIKVYNTHKEGVIYDEEMVRMRYGVMPDRVTDLMAIMGDTSDNIPGIPGIGEKGARDLMEQYGSLDALLENLDKLKSESKRKLIESNIDKARLSKDLATLDDHVPLEIDFSRLESREQDKNALMEIFKELEFKSLMKEIMPETDLGGDYTLIDTSGKLDSFLKELAGQKEFVFDFETTHHDPMLAKPVGVSFSWREGKAFYIPFNLNKDISAERVFEKLKPIFTDPGVRKIGQNIKYEYIVLKNRGIELKGIYFDTMIASYLINPQKMNHNLGDISIEYLGHKMTDIEELIGKGKKATTMDLVPVDKVLEYSCADSDVTLRVKKILEETLKEKGMDSLFFDMEMPLLEVLASMEMEGVGLDSGYLKKLSRDMEKKLEILEKEIFKLAGSEFNINSPKQLQAVLFDTLKMPIVKRTKTGPSTDESVLKSLSERYELPREILKYREFSKLKSTYVDALPDLINPATKRIHTSFNQTVTQTGRLSSSSPNLQNIPIKTEEGRKIRRAFIPYQEDFSILSADYSQIELRVLAHLSGDKNLKSAFREGKDIHRFTASLVYNVEEKDVTPEMRNSAKTVNFGIIYGMSPYGLSKDLGIDIEDAKAFIDNYFSRYPDVKLYLEDRIREARMRKYVTTIMNRRRYVPEITSDSIGIRNFAERTAVNAPIQGSAADIIKMAMINIAGHLKPMKSRMILQVHDELVFDIFRKELKSAIPIIRDGMEKVIKLDVPIVVNMKIGKNWLELEEVSS